MRRWLGTCAAITVVALTFGCSSKHAREPTVPATPTATAALAATTDPHATPTRRPPPTADPTPIPTRTPIATGIAVLDSVLNFLGRNEAWISLADVAAMPCDDARPAERPPCDGSATGSPVMAFYAAGCVPAFVTTQEEAAAEVKRALENRRGGEIYGVISGGVPDLTDEGYTMIVRWLTGNGGNFWYLSPEGRIVAIRNACGSIATVPERDFRGTDFLYGPCFGGCRTQTPTP